MRRLFVTVSLAALVIAGALPDALAYLKAGPPMAGPGHHRLKGVSGSVPPIDGFTTPFGAYGFRKLLSSYSGNAMRLRRASDNAELDIGFLGCTGFTGCPWDEAAARAHCNLTTCFSATDYDQSGAARNRVPATAANQPAVIFDCNGSLPCWRITAATQNALTVANVTPATGIVSLSVVAKRSGGTGNCIWLRADGATGNRMTTGVANIWSMSPGVAMTATATDGVFHAAIGVINGASSLMNIDGTETAGTVVGVTTAGTAGFTGPGAPTVCDEEEAVFWDNVTLTPAQRTALAANYKSYFGTP